ncbi:MAG: PilN domain-containing protein [Syntrophales bacterium]|nr:PilN domain-containing protein [Syntrophales bacterium]
MIRINLLPYRDIAKKETALKKIIIISGSAVIFVGVLLGVYFFFLATNSGLEKDVKAREKRIAELNKIVGEIEGYKREKQILEKKIAAIEELEKGRTYPVQLLADLASRVPTRDMWLEKLSYSGTNLQLEGTARDTFAIVRFMRALEASSLVASVELVSAKEKEISGTGLKLQQFSLNCGLKKGS